MEALVSATLEGTCGWSRLYILGGGVKIADIAAKGCLGHVVLCTAWERTDFILPPDHCLRGVAAGAGYTFAQTARDGVLYTARHRSRCLIARGNSERYQPHRRIQNKA